ASCASLPRWMWHLPSPTSSRISGGASLLQDAPRIRPAAISMMIWFWRSADGSPPHERNGPRPDYVGDDPVINYGGIRHRPGGCSAKRLPSDSNHGPSGRLLVES